MRNPQNVLESLKSKACNKEYSFQRLYRNLYNPEWYYLAYQNIYAKEGNMTAGSDSKTIDGMSAKRIDRLIASLKDHSYHPNPARRTYIQKTIIRRRSVHWVSRPLMTNCFKRLSV